MNDEVHLSLESPFIKYEVYMSIGNIKVVANASKRYPFQINVPTFFRFVVELTDFA